MLEDRLQVLPTFGVVAPNFRMFEPPAVTFPGIDIDLSKVLHGTQSITVHARSARVGPGDRPRPASRTCGTRARRR